MLTNHTVIAKTVEKAITAADAFVATGNASSYVIFEVEGIYGTYYEVAFTLALAA